jgi:L-ribulose-5-phosphate 4-epimerase
VTDPRPAAPTHRALLPELTAREELVLLARTLWREGYDDHLAGHITYRQDEIRPEDVLVIDREGALIEGNWPVPLGIPLHVELHRLRDDIGVTVHSHPQFGTVWADLGRLPGCYDQSSALGGGELVLVDEYDGPVDSRDSAARAAAAVGTADMALLANHGVLVTAGSIRAAHQRAVALEHRCRRAWQIEAVGPGRELPEPARSFFGASDGEGFHGFFEAMARRELRLDPGLLGPGRSV